MFFSLTVAYYLLLLGQSLVSEAADAKSKNKNNIYLIRNAETASLNLPGLTPIGEERANICLPKALGPLTDFDIGYIIACTPVNDTGECITAPLTVQPLADALGLTVDTSCSTSDADGGSDFIIPRANPEDDSDDNCVGDAVDAFTKTSDKAILICWDADDMDDLTEALNVDDTPDFPEGNYDVIFQLSNDEFISQFSQNCTGIDGQSPQSVQLFGTTPLPDEDSDDAFIYPKLPLH